MPDPWPPDLITSGWRVTGIQSGTATSGITDIGHVLRIPAPVGSDLAMREGNSLRVIGTAIGDELGTIIAGIATVTAISAMMEVAASDVRSIQSTRAMNSAVWTDTNPLGEDLHARRKL
jgi:hypothetical protein